MQTLNLRIIHTHDTEENWDRCDNFIPKMGEIIVYDCDTTHLYERFKIGDGKTSIKNLPFTVDNIIESIFNISNQTIYADAGRITDYEDSIT